VVGLESIGWRAELGEALAALGDPSLAARRVVSADRRGVRVSDGVVEAGAVVPGRMRHRTRARSLPVVGDWVAVRAGPDPVIEAVLPRRSELVRRDPDQRSEQVLAANVDTAIVVMGLDGDFNLRRLERYLTLVRAAGVGPVIVLSKADLCSDVARKLADVEDAASGVPVLALSLVVEDGHQPVEAFLPAGLTAVLLGSSGAGKSTLLNGLLGRAAQRTGDVREHDSRGRHTTTVRQLFALPGGAAVIDTPGLRELELIGADAGLAEAFPELAELAATCRFRDCRHQDEPDCALRAAEQAGTVTSARLAGYRKLAAELARPQRAPRRRR
jgi:ribosome biogenesis GTPase / thiamine phosphate phosphatase